MQDKGSSSEPHVAVFVFPFASHPACLLSLVRRIAAAAPNARFSFFSSAGSNGSIFAGPDADGFDNIRPYSVWDGMPEGHVPCGNPEEEIELFMKAAPENLKRGIEKAVVETERKISCLVTDAFLWFGGAMAEEMDIPWVPIWMSAPWSLSAHVYTDVIRETIGISGIAGREGETLDFIPGFSAVRLGDLPEGIIFGNLESSFSCMMHNMGRMLPRATTVAIQSWEELDPTNITKDLKSKLQNILSVGPASLITSKTPTNSDEHGCLAWLDKHKAASVAYIGFGTVITPPPNEMVALAEALEASGVPFLWSLKGDMKDHLPNGFLERMSTCGKVVPWAPQLQVLKHGSTGVFVTHGGWNSVTESIAGGVPMICRPFFGDQGLNARMVEDEWKIGVGVEGGVFTTSGIMKALELIFWHDEGKKMRENIGVLKDLAVKTMGSDGNCVKSLKTLLEVVTKFKDTSG